jgi:hypothetical protein
MPMVSLNFSTPKSLNNFYIYLVGGAIDILSMIIMGSVNARQKWHYIPVKKWTLLFWRELDIVYSYSVIDIEYTLLTNKFLAIIMIKDCVFFLTVVFFHLKLIAGQIDEPMHLLLSCHFLSMIDLSAVILQF